MLCDAVEAKLDSTLALGEDFQELGLGLVFWATWPLERPAFSQASQSLLLDNMFLKTLKFCYFS